MKHTFAFALLGIFIVPTVLLAQSEFEEPGTGNQRIENEDKLTVPDSLKEEVWNYLVERFVTSQEFLQSLDPLLTSEISEEYFTDRYYDTPEFTNLQNKNGLRHRKRENITNPEDAKDGRELMQIKVNGISADDPLARAEYKYDIEYPTVFSSQDDRHPLIGLVTPNDRPEFIAQVRQSLKIDPYQAKFIIAVNQRRRRVYIKRDGVSALTVTFDEVTSKAGDAEVAFTEIEPEINEILYTDGDEALRTHLKSIQTAIINDIQTKYPEIVRDLTPKYNKSFERLEQQDPWLRQKVLYGESSLMMWVILAVLCPLFLLAFWIYTRRRNAISLA